MGLRWVWCSSWGTPSWKSCHSGSSSGPRCLRGQQDALGQSNNKQWNITILPYKGSNIWTSNSWWIVHLPCWLIKRSDPHNIMRLQSFLRSSHENPRHENPWNHSAKQIHLHWHEVASSGNCSLALSLEVLEGTKDVWYLKERHGLENWKMDANSWFSDIPLPCGNFWEGIHWDISPLMPST